MLLNEIKEALKESEISSDGARRLNLLALSGLIEEVSGLRTELKTVGEGMDKRLKDVERMLPWVRGLAWFVGVVGVALVGAVVRLLIP